MQGLNTFCPLTKQQRISFEWQVLGWRRKDGQPYTPLPPAAQACLEQHKRVLYTALPVLLAGETPFVTNEVTETWLTDDQGTRALLRHAVFMEAWLRECGLPAVSISPLGRYGKVHVVLDKRGLWGIMSQVRPLISVRTHAKAIQKDRQRSIRA